MTKASTRVEHKILYDDVNQICCMQWRYTKVMNLVSTLNYSLLRTCERHHGSSRLLQMTTTSIVQKCMWSTKVINSELILEVLLIEHPSKWYTKVFLAILDCAALNAYSFWNLSCE